MSANWYQNKLLIISTLVGSFLAGTIGYGMSTPRYALFKLGRAIDAKNLQQGRNIAVRCSKSSVRGLRQILPRS